MFVMTVANNYEHKTFALAFFFFAIYLFVVSDFDWVNLSVNL